MKPDASARTGVDMNKICILPSRVLPEEPLRLPTELRPRSNTDFPTVKRSRARARGVIQFISINEQILTLHWFEINNINY